MSLIVDSHTWAALYFHTINATCMSSQARKSWHPYCRVGLGGSGIAHVSC